VLIKKTTVISLYFLLQKISLKMPADKTPVKPEAGFEK
jgi:hypothetical protein